MEVWLSVACVQKCGGVRRLRTVEDQNGERLLVGGGRPKAELGAPDDKIGKTNRTVTKKKK